MEPAIDRMNGEDYDGRRLTVKRATARGEKLSEGGNEDEQTAETDDGWGVATKKKGGSKNFKAHASSENSCGLLCRSFVGWSLFLRWSQ